MATHTTQPDRGGSNGGETLPERVVDGLIEPAPRRRLLTILRDAGEPVAVDDLAGRLAEAGSANGSESDGGETAEADAGTGRERRRARAEIYQHHLPRLTETGAVAFDSRLGTVEFTGGPRLRARLDDENPDARAESGVDSKDK